MKDTLEELHVLQAVENTKHASRKLPLLSDGKVQSILHEIADQTLARIPYLLEQNQKDLDRMDTEDPKYDRLLLNESRLEGIANDLRKVAALPSPLSIALEERRLANGLWIKKVTVPIGVIGLVFESRPNVTFDVFALCFKSGNASVLKGSRDAHYSNCAIIDLIKDVLQPYGLEDIVYLAPSERLALPMILEADHLIDVIIPRGSQSLIDFVRKHATVPVIETGAGIVHTYFDDSGDKDKGRQIVENAKTRRVSVCNALDTLLIHENRLCDLPYLLKDLDQKYGLEVRADAPAYAHLVKSYSKHLLLQATPEDFGTEFLSMRMSIKTVQNLQGALDHIATYSSKHSEAIIADDERAIQTFYQQVDAATVYANASTAFTDGGVFGLGAEIGISTQKLHARGPMGLRELTSYKWLVTGQGHVRSSQ